VTFIQEENTPDQYHKRVDRKIQSVKIILHKRKSAMIEVKESAIHGKGVFAVRAILREDHIGTFEGPRVEEDGTHVLWVYDEISDQWYGIKGENDLRFLNHSNKPNAEFNSAGELHALRSIASGEEITIHYGEEWE
jgi:SET domain-containing protein